MRNNLHISENYCNFARKFGMRYIKQPEFRKENILKQ